MSNLLQVSITGLANITRPVWPDTENGALYRSVLLQYVEAAPGFMYRVFPQYHEVHTVFDSEANLRAFLAAHKDFLAELHGAAKQYYEADAGCSIEVTVKCDSKPDLVISDVANPNSYVLAE